MSDEGDFARERLRHGDYPIAVVRLLRERGLSLKTAKEVVDRNVPNDVREANDRLRDVAFDGVYYDDLRGSISGLLIDLADRLSSRTSDFVTEFIDHDEFGLALETMAEMLCEEGSAITVEERDRMIDLVSTMKMDDRVARNAGLCPIRS